MGQITDNKLGGVINFHNTIVTASSDIGRKESFVRDCAIHRNGCYFIAAINYKFNKIKHNIINKARHVSNLTSSAGYVFFL